MKPDWPQMESTRPVVFKTCLSPPPINYANTMAKTRYSRLWRTHNLRKRRAGHMAQAGRGDHCGTPSRQVANNETGTPPPGSLISTAKARVGGVNGGF
jgi:hypothetical protein